MSLGSSLREVLAVGEGAPDGAPLLQNILDDLRQAAPRVRAKAAAEKILAGLQDQLEASGWWSPSWLDDTLNAVQHSFEAACDRWRGLYQAAVNQFDTQTRAIRDQAGGADKTTARRLRSEAEKQLSLLLAEDDRRTQSDFYSYRYFASEGFLPGYSFPRLPLSAFIPGGRRFRDDAEYVSRPRFLAISEFGPKSLIYHEGARFEVNRVILPVGEEVGAAGEPVLTSQAKRCELCGYFHPVTSTANPDVCDRCGAQLGAPLASLFRLQNVATRRRDRISSDEEERRREGYEVHTAVRFAERARHVSVTTAEVAVGGTLVARLAYGDTARIWRINVGRRRREDPDRLGFVLDVDNGYWKNDGSEADGDDDAPPEPNSARTQRVVPYVEDDRNCLLFEPVDQYDNATMASLMSALKQAIQVAFQLEDDELAAEALPSNNDRRLLLFYEAAEGGAGVLRRLVDDPDALALVARQGLEVCHFDPDTGEDRARAPGAKDPCEAACYDCLMSYRNQLDHQLLDRQLAAQALRVLTAAKVTAGSQGRTPEQQRDELLRLSDSELEREWLRFLEDHELRMPDHGNVYISEAGTRPDFVYEHEGVAIYVDGPPHDYPERAARDADANARMRDLGYTVVRFGHADDWSQIVDSYRWVFGDGR
jgi:very-short-patch-repair endonuclease